MSVYLYPCKHQTDKTVVLSSGLGGHAHFWQPQIEALTEHFQVLCYDQEGVFSDSPQLPDGYSMLHLAEQLAEILQQNKLHACHFIGHALGGFIGLELAKHYPELVDKLVLINAWDQLDAHTQKCFQARTALLQHAGIEAYVRAQALFLYPPAWISAHATSLQAQEDKMIASFAPVENVLKRLNALQQYRPAITASEIENQTLVIVNQDDFLVPWQRGFALAKLIKHAELELLTSGAHASTVTQMASVNDILIKFLNQA
ncbi:MAG: pyrimidine utilization protein D [Acinetobacter populi]|jgi:aminoacrylate hydrolase|uniref:pyrimidine utilization protein D n=1 Tax=Acinetobacter populi TaxID=1582270 RepID=UPI0023544460|nr:pyrimidine utilization protein D [Acinetobacter populi]MCH4248166.1 pyrimidine utilization protein D [Acinetobacter populi]